MPGNLNLRGSLPDECGLLMDASVEEDISTV